MDEKDSRILVVDDEQDLCEILKFNLETEGYQVETANSAEEALEKDIASYNLLLLDVMMGGMSGFQLAKQLKNSEVTAHIPIIFLTARDTENDTVTGFNLGAAIAALNLLEPGVYISMSGRIFPAESVRKDRSRGIFEG